MQPAHAPVGPSARKHPRGTFEIVVSGRSVVVFDVVCAVCARRAGFGPVSALWVSARDGRFGHRSGPRRPSRCAIVGSRGPTDADYWEPSKTAIAEVLIASHGFESARHGFTTVRCHKVNSKPWLAIRTSAIASLDGSHELVPVGPPEPKELQRDGLLCPERRSGRASTRADQSDRSGLKPALLAHMAHTTSNTTTERSYTTISKVTRVCFRALGPTVPYSGSIGYIRLRRVHTAHSGLPVR